MGRPGGYYNTRTPHPNPDRLGGLPRAAHGVRGSTQWAHPLPFFKSCTHAPGEAPSLKPFCLYLQEAPRPRETGLQQEGGAGTPETQPGPMESWTSALTLPRSEALLPLIRPALTLPPSRVPSLPAPGQFGRTVGTRGADGGADVGVWGGAGLTVPRRGHCEAGGRPPLERGARLPPETTVWGRVGRDLSSGLPPQPSVPFQYLNSSQLPRPQGSPPAP